MSNESAPTTGPPPTPTIHEAFLASGLTGIVDYGAELDFASAVARRLSGENVVVRGTNIHANRRLAEAIEAAAGPCSRSDPHQSAGPKALPHYQQDNPPPTGHTFYETPRRKARKKP